MDVQTSEQRQNHLAQRIIDSDTTGGMRSAGSTWESPDWLLDLVARVDVLIQEETVTYVTATFRDGVGKAVVVTGTRIVVATIDAPSTEGDQQLANLSVRAVSVQQVRGITVDEVSPGTDRQDWPSRLRVTLAFADGEPDLTLPAPTTTWNRSGRELAAVVSTLLAKG